MKSTSSKLTRLRRRRTAAEIAALLDECRRSGLSMLAFAQQRRLCYASLLRWNAQRPSPPSCAMPPAFIAVEIEPSSGSADFLLSWPGGRSLRIPAGFDAQALRRLLDVLEAEP